ncbi:MAG: FMN-binding protein [Planctomycetota bacterium]
MIRTIALFAVLMCCASSFIATAEEPNPNQPPVPVEFYFSKKDPRLSETEKALAAVVKQLPMIKIERVAIDDKAGYQRLADVERMFDIKTPGDMTMAFGPYILVNKGAARDIDLYFGSMMKRLIGQMKGDNSFKDRITPNVAFYAEAVFGKGATAVIEPEQKGNSIMLYRAFNGGKQAGWIADAYDPIGCPICSSAQLFLAASPTLQVLDVSPIREIEKYGVKAPDAEVAAFVAQFRGKTPANPPVKVDAVSRATKTSHAFLTSVAETLDELKKRAKP